MPRSALKVTVGGGGWWWVVVGGGGGGVESKLSVQLSPKLNNLKLEGSSYYGIRSSVYVLL